MRAQVQGAALNFDGNNDYISTPSIAFGNNWTVEGWIRPTNINGIYWNSVMGQVFYNNNQGFVIAIIGGEVFLDGPTTGGPISAPLISGVWTHVAVTYNNGIIAFYKDGLLIGSRVATVTSSSTNFLIGVRTSNNGAGLMDAYQGDMDEIRIWNTTRTQCEILSYMNCEIPTSATGLISNYHFNQGAYNSTNTGISTLNDNSGLFRNGTLNNFGYTGLTSNWTAPGGVISNFTTPFSPLPEINIKGNGTSIPDGTSIVSLTNHTDFGTAGTRTFVVESSGSHTLNIGTPLLTGTNPSEFSIIAQPSTLLASGSGSTSFVVAFTPTSTGTKSANIVLYNSDCSEPFYSFVISATTSNGAALNFDGVNDYIETNANLAELGQADFTLESWIRTTSTSQGVINFQDGDAIWEAGEKCLYIDAAGKPTFVGFGNGYIPSNVAINDGQWHHVAVTWDHISAGSGIARIYIDGVDQTNTGGLSYVGANLNGSGTFKFGRTNYNAPEAPNSFNGQLDEIRVWNRALCLPELTNNRNCELPSPTTQSGLTGYYRFNAGLAFGTNTSVTSVTDNSFYSNNGILTNFSLSGGPVSNWISPGAVTSNVNCTTFLYPEINLNGNGNDIANNDSSPSPADHTNFGNIALGGVLTRTFMIQNQGTAVLTIASCSLTGAAASSFTIVANPVANISAGGTSSVIVSFSAATLGIKNASVVVNSNDCDESVYSFAITANGATPGAALSFNATNDYVTMSDPNLGTSDCTIEAWFKQTTASVGGYLLTTRSSEGGPNGNWWAIGLGAGTNQGSIGLELAVAGSNYTALATDNGLFGINAWNHLAIVRSGTLISIYLNGSLAQSFIDPIIRNWNTGANKMRIGGWVEWNGAWLDGAIDELRVWNVARTQCEIQSYMNCEFTGTPASLLANYHFNQGVDGLPNTGLTLLTDASLSARTGTLTNFSLTGTGSNWIAPGGVVSGFTTVSTPSVEIDVRGNGNSIIDGNTGTSPVDFTDFNGVITRTFTIHNTISGGTLNIGAPFLTGTNSNQFSITAVPATSIVGIGSTSFVVAFLPSSTGVKTATINIQNNDCSEPAYDFVISATTTAAEALNLDGVNDIVNVPGIILNNQSFTIEFWAKRGSNGTNGIVVGQGSVVSLNQAMQIGFRNSDQFTFAFYLNDINYLGPQTTDGNFHHWACVYDATAVGKNRFLYCDGQLLMSDFSNSPFLGSGSLVIGNTGYGSNAFNGTVDELRVWNEARSQCDIQSYMRCEISGSLPSLIANYHFNQGFAAAANGTVTTLTDDTAVPKNGILSNFALSGLGSNWILPGAVSSGSTTPAIPTATLAFEGNGNPILAGSTIPSLSNFTDFGTATTRTLVLRNTGTDPLYITTGYFTGANASNFTVTTTPSSVIPGAGSSSVVISFSPTTPGTYSAVLTVVTSDCTHPQYSFALAATPAPASALNFDGLNDYIACPNSIVSTFTNGLVSGEAWVNMSVPATYQSIIKNWGQSNGVTGAFHLGATSGGNNIEIYITQSNGTVVSVADPAPLTLGTWYHIAFVADGSKLHLYKNGLEVGSPVSYDGTLWTSQPGLFIGAKPNDLGTAPSATLASHWHGKLDEIRLWNVARSQCEILTYMNCEIPATASGLVANYHFNQGIPSGSNTAVTTLIDATGGAAGILNNFSLTGAGSNWVSPGSIINDYTTAVVPAATLALSGNGNTVPVGMTTSTNNFTDFGLTTSRTFVIQNPGTGSLYVNGGTFSGANASCFSITTQPLSVIAGGGSSNFVISFTPSAVGSQSAILNISSSDCTSPNYSFVITASTAPASALSFDGNDDQVILNDPAFGTSDFTIETWAKVNSFANHTYLLSTRMLEGGGNGNYWDFGVNIAGEAFFETADDGSTPLLSLTSPASTLTAGTWNHLAAVRSGSQISIYVNGILTARGYAQGITNLYSSNGTMIFSGSGAGLAMFNGALDEVRIWNYARTQCEILTYMNAEIPGSAGGLMRNYHFNQGVPSGSNTAVTSLTDAAGPGSGTLTNFALTGSISNWVIPGAVANDFTTAVVPDATLTLSGNGNNVPQGTATSPANFTDFGSAGTRTFVIQNPGTNPLYMNGITFSGAGASSFTVNTQPSGTIAGSGSDNLVIYFTPTVIGTYSAIVTLNSSDCSNPNYSFVITGSASAASALNFDGTGSYVDLGAGSLLKPVNALSAEAWVYSSNWPSQDQTIFGNTENAGYGLFTRTTGNLEGLVRRNSAWGGVTAPLSGLSPGWHHVALTYDGQYTRLYIDGVMTSEDDAGAVYPIDYISNNTLIGGEASSGSAPIPGWFFNGSVDELRIWNVARTQCEIQTYMSCEIPNTPPGLVANYHFNQGIPSGLNMAVTTLSDAIGATNGNLIGMTLSGPVANWVSPGGVANDYTVTSIPAATLQVSGNGNAIAPGSAAALLNFTDFGGAPVRTFSVLNSGTTPLYINHISISGANSPEFNLGATPAASLTAGGSNSFAINFVPSSLGTKSAVVNIYSSDCTFPTYSFVITATAVTGASIEFDGIDDYIDLGTDPALKPANALTAETWAYMSSWTGSVTFVGNAQLSGYTLRTDGTNLSAMVYVNGGFLVASTPLAAIPAGWHHLALTFDGRYVTLYVDGVLKSTADAGAVYVVTYAGNNVLLAAEASTGMYPVGGFLKGRLDEVRIWNRALCQGEIQNNMNCEVSVTGNGLVANYHFNEGIAFAANTTVSTLPDLSGNALNGGLRDMMRTGTVSNWIAPGAVTSGSSCSMFITPEIDVESNGISIPDGAMLPGTVNNTDFGSTCVASQVVKTFTILNTGSAPLSVSSISLSGSNAASFSVGILSPASPVASGSLAVFSLSFMPSSAGVKTATVNISNSDCDEGLYDFAITGTANAIPTVTASISNSIVCAGTGIILSGSGADTYTWSPSVTNAVSFTPVANQTYTLSGSYTLTGCTNTNLATQAVTVNAIPSVTIATSTPTICSGLPATLTASGADTYTWLPGPLNGATITPSPMLSTTYTLTGTSLAGCTSTNLASQLITVNTTPTLVTTIGSSSICAGSSATAGVSGASTYSWYPGALGGGTIVSAPSVNTTYTVVGYSSTGCISSNSINITVTVNALPSVTANTTHSIVCSGFTTSLFGTGADSYTWSGGISDGVPFIPSVTDSYTVTGTYTLTGCTSTNLAVQTVTVNSVPSVTATAVNSVICEGSSATLTASGADTYTWNPGNFTGASFNPSPLVLTTYTLTGTNLAGCTSTNLATQSISVNPLPTVTANISSSVVCSGASITLSGSGANTYTWNNGVTDGVQFAPAASGIYSVTGTSSAGCTSTNVATVSVTVHTLPSLTIQVTKAALCLGEQTQLSGSGALTYTWSNAITNNVAFSPTITATYTLSATDANTCENTAVTTVTVHALPVLTVSGTPSLSCEAETTTLTVSGASSYTWNTGATSSGIIITPTATTVFTIVATDLNTCTNTVSYTQSVSPCPGTFTAYTTSRDVSCKGKNDGQIIIVASASYTQATLNYTWDPALPCSSGGCDTLNNLKAGSYHVTVKVTYTLNGSLVKTDSLKLGPVVINDLNGDCGLTVFNGVTANGDGINDVLTIENIAQYPNNRVTVFNRWGQQVFDMKGYNNTDKAWPLKEDLSKLSSNTYFYVIEPGDGSKLIKGWIELFMN